MPVASVLRVGISGAPRKNMLTARSYGGSCRKDDVLGTYHGEAEQSYERNRREQQTQECTAYVGRYLSDNTQDSKRKATRRHLANTSVNGGIDGHEAIIVSSCSYKFTGPGATLGLI